MRLAIAVCLVLTGCAAGPQPAPDVTFVIENRATDVEDTDYATMFYHQGAVRAIGDSAALAQSYVVFYHVRRVEGGDPEEPRDATDWLMVPVRNGRGEFRFYGGSKDKARDYMPGVPADTFSVEVVEYVPIGFVPLQPVQQIAPVR